MGVKLETISPLKSTLFDHPRQRMGTCFIVMSYVLNYILKHYLNHPGNNFNFTNAVVANHLIIQMVSDTGTIGTCITDSNVKLRKNITIKS